MAVYNTRTLKNAKQLAMRKRKAGYACSIFKKKKGYGISVTRK